jgi:hypothetical protein
MRFRPTLKVRRLSAPVSAHGGRQCAVNLLMSFPMVGW